MINEDLYSKIINNAMHETEQHSTAQSIVLHLLPGAVATVVFVLAVPPAVALGYPSITALYLPTILTVILLELGYLLVQGQKRNGVLSLEGIVNYREPVPGSYYFVFPILIVIWGVVVTALVSPIDNLILTRVFAWLPDWYALRNLADIPQLYSRQALLITAFFAILLNGIVGPLSKSFTIADISCRAFPGLVVGRPWSTLYFSRSITSGRHGCFCRASCY